MDSSAVVAAIVLSALFFGFIVWLAVISRGDGIEEISPETAERKLKEE